MSQSKNISGIYALYCRLSLIQRWSLKHCIRREDDLEHSAMVAILSTILGFLARKSGKTIEIEKMISHGICHDFSEIITGDINTPTKHNNPVILAEFRKLEKAAEKKLLHTSPAPLLSMFKEAFDLDGYGAKLVKAADIYAAYIKAKLEYDLNNQIEFRVALSELEERIKIQTEITPELALLDRCLITNLAAQISSHDLRTIAKRTFLTMCAAQLAKNVATKLDYEQMLILSLFGSEMQANNLQYLFSYVKTNLNLATELKFVDAASTLVSLIDGEQVLARIESQDQTPSEKFVRAFVPIKFLFDIQSIEVPEIALLKQWFLPAFSVSVDELLAGQNLNVVEFDIAC